MQGRTLNIGSMFAGSSSSPVGRYRDISIQIFAKAATGSWRLELPKAVKTDPMYVTREIMPGACSRIGVADSFYKNITLYMTQFWVSFSPRPLSLTSHTLQLRCVAVFFLQQLLRPNRIRVLDSVALQRCFHTLATLRYRHLRSIRVRAYIGQISTAIHPRSA